MQGVHGDPYNELGNCIFVPNHRILRVFLHSGGAGAAQHLGMGPLHGPLGPLALKKLEKIGEVLKTKKHRAEIPYKMTCCTAPYLSR